MQSILLVDPYPVVTYGLSQMLHETGIANPVVHAHSLSQAHHAIDGDLALLVMDPAMADTTPDTFVVQARRHHPDLPILFFSSQPYGIYLALAQRLGVNGYLEKTTDLPTASAAIRMIMSGMQCFPRQDEYAAKKCAALNRLSQRELVILQYLRQGLRNKDIAERLYLSPKTVSTHKRSLLRKLGTSDVVSNVLETMLVQTKNLPENNTCGDEQSE